MSHKEESNEVVVDTLKTDQTPKRKGFNIIIRVTRLDMYLSFLATFFLQVYWV